MPCELRRANCCYLRHPSLQALRKHPKVEPLALRRGAPMVSDVLVHLSGELEDDQREELVEPSVNSVCWPCSLFMLVRPSLRAVMATELFVYDLFVPSVCGR